MELLKLDLLAMEVWERFADFQLMFTFLKTLATLSSVK